MKPKVVVCVVGSTNIDLLLTVPLLPIAGETVLARSAQRLPGGKGANQAVALARLGAEARFHSAVGDDGGWVREHLASEGVDVDHVTVHPDADTGLAVVTVDGAGENSIVVVPGANDRVLSPSDLSGVDVLLLSLEIPLETVQETVRTAYAAGVPVVLNAAPAAALDVALLRLVDVLVVNESEAALLGLGDLPAASAATVITQGAQGVLVREASGTTTVAAHPASVVDTTGAGDCFAAALAYGLGEGRPLVEAARFAVVAAALSVEQVGAQQGLPTLVEVTAASHDG